MHTKCEKGGILAPPHPPQPGARHWGARGWVSSRPDWTTQGGPVSKSKAEQNKTKKRKKKKQKKWLKGPLARVAEWDGACLVCTRPGFYTKLCRNQTNKEGPGRCWVRDARPHHCSDSVSHGDLRFLVGACL